MKKLDLTYIFFFLFLISIYKDINPTPLSQGTNSPDGTTLYRANGTAIGISSTQSVVLVKNKNIYADEIRPDSKITYSVAKYIELPFVEARVIKQTLLDNNKLL
jgi:hypothetical protein